MVASAPGRELTIGVLALQGGVAEHMAALRRLGAEAREVKLPADLEGIDGLIVPGGESTTIGKLMRRYGLLEPVREAVRRDFPVYGTCAGMILVADEILDAAKDQPSVGGMDIAVRRNAFGRQVDSFEADLDIEVLKQLQARGENVGGDTGSAALIRQRPMVRVHQDPPVGRRELVESAGTFHGVFIRAPFIERVGSEVDVLARLTDNTPVAARQGRLLVSAFHPELTPDGRMHEYFLGICAGDAGRVEDSSERRRSSPESQSVMATP